MELNVLFLFLLFAVAFLYASVGHGGASGYLALMALFNFAPPVMKSSALLLNIFVSFIAFVQYYRGGYFKWKLFLPFAVTSIPAAFIGAFITVDAVIYKKILGIILIFPILRLLGLLNTESDELKDTNIVIALITGLIIGFLSGLLGIGGGIILSPVILLLHYGNMKQTASVSALFIFVNSIAGFTSLLSKGITIEKAVYIWLLVAVTGGLLGAYWGSKKWNNLWLKRVLAIVLCIASFKLIFS
ncbi:MAG: sulfite exporter TauE/SafE family protein [Chitinophagales bacterium]